MKALIKRMNVPPIRRWRTVGSQARRALGLGGILWTNATIDAIASVPELEETSRSPKTGHHLFNPTPRAQLREMNTDRPDKTESPYTVDAGHLQLEMDVLNYSYDRYNTDHSQTRVESVSIAPLNFKLGLLNNVDLQFVAQTYQSVRVHDYSAGTVEKKRGFGDLVTRAKINFWGNDGGPTAFAMMPFLKLPTNQDGLGNNAVEGGVIFPLAIVCPHGWALGMMTEFDFNRDAAGRNYHTEFVNSITLSRTLLGNLAGYVEWFSSVSTESGSAWLGTFDVGFTYGLTSDIQLDAGISIGITRSAEDLNPFLGISVRF